MTKHSFLMFEPFCAGSHKTFAEGLVAHSSHHIDLIWLPARFWKWRMRGAALHFASSGPRPERFDGLLLTNLMSASDLRGLWAKSCPPILLYFHESQLTYPSAVAHEADLQLAFTDITSALAAERVIFNSHSHRDAFLAQMAALIARMPDFRPHWVIETIRAKSSVIYPGCDLPPAVAQSRPKPAQAPLIIWNHRWEFDKNPELFVTTLERLSRRGCDFQVALLGERFRRQPPCLERARQSLARHIAFNGQVPERVRYYEWLQQGQIVVSTAIQENFGLSVIEAIASGCVPLLPRRLSYPELLPAELHESLLYENDADLETKLATLLSTIRAFDPCASQLQRFVRDRFAWPQRIGQFDTALTELACCR